MSQTTLRATAHKLGMPVDNFSDREINQYARPVTNNGQTLKSEFCVPITAALTIGAVAYFVYLGRTARRISPQKVVFAVTVAGASTQVGEVGLFSSPLPPGGAAQTLTKLMASGTLDALTGTGVLGNTTAFSTDVSAGVHLWAGYRVDMAGDEPTVLGLTQDMGRGTILSLAAATAFTSGTTYAGGLIAHSVAWQAPALFCTIL